MEKLRNTLNKVLNLLAGLSMTVMVVLTTYQVHHEERLTGEAHKPRILQY